MDELDLDLTERDSIERDSIERDSIERDSIERDSIERDSIEEAVLMPQPKLTKTISNNVSHQRQDPTCYAHVAARVLLRYFQVYVINPKGIPGNNETSELKEANSPCDDLYLDPLHFCNIKKKGKCDAKHTNLLEKCGGNEYEHLCLILYMFFYTLIVDKIGCYYTVKDSHGQIIRQGGGFLIAALTQVVDVIYDINNIINIQKHCFMAVSDCAKIRDILMENYRDNDIEIINFGTHQRFYEVIDLAKRYVSGEQLYLGIKIDGVICKFKEDNPDTPVPSEIIKSTKQPHIVTLVDYIPETDTMIVKNSWGKSAPSHGLLSFNTSEVSQFVDCYVTGVSHTLRHQDFFPPTGTIYSLCIRNEVEELNTLLSDLLEYKTNDETTYEEYCDDNQVYIQQSFMFVINAGRNDMFKQLLLVFGNITMYDDESLFDYLLISSPCHTDPGNMGNLIKIIFEYCSFDENRTKFSIESFDDFLNTLKIHYDKPVLIKYIKPFEILFAEYKTRVVELDELKPEDLSIEAFAKMLWEKYSEEGKILYTTPENSTNLRNDYNVYFHTNIGYSEFDMIYERYIIEDEFGISKVNFIKMWVEEEQRLKTGKGIKRQTKKRNKRHYTKKYNKRNKRHYTKKYKNQKYKNQKYKNQKYKKYSIKQPK